MNAANLTHLDLDKLAAALEQLDRDLPEEVRRDLLTPPRGPLARIMLAADALSGRISRLDLGWLKESAR